MIITDLVYEQIRNDLGLYAPERGGALYGPKGYPVSSHFEYDDEGATTSVSYVPSSRLIANVVQIETGTGLQFKGIVHSHPAGYSHPSEGDRTTAGSFFKLNPHFAVMAMPIVQRIAPGPSAHEQPFLHWFRAELRAPPPQALGFLYRSSSGPVVDIIEEEFYVLPLWTHMEKLIAELRTHGFMLGCEKKVQHLRIANAQLLGLVASDSYGHELMYFVPFDYPVVSPIVFYQRRNVTANLKLHWDGLKDPDESLKRLVEELLGEWSSATPKPGASPENAV